MVVTAGMMRLYRRFARVVPVRFTGGGNVSASAHAALLGFLEQEGGLTRKSAKFWRTWYKPGSSG